MNNPWKEIKLSDYENHMQLETVMQLQALNEMMKSQFEIEKATSIMILGVAGGNGLEHINSLRVEKVYGIDINEDYLKECRQRYKELNVIAEYICEDLTKENEYIVKLDKVYFQYPNNDNYALKNIDLKIKKNEIIAVVGGNGSGKSTLARLISTIYQPTSGEVLTVPKQRVSMICQNFQKYKMNLKDNIICSSYTTPYCLKELIKIAENAGIGSKFLKSHIEKMLSKEFGGTDLSGGQWQRIAIARGLYKENDLIILDEPTSSINPIDESRIFNQFRKISKNKTAIYITHRLGSVKIADRIIVLRDGEIVEEGSFFELIQYNGYFSDLYNAQAQWYENT